MKRWPQAAFNIEGNPLHNLMDLLRELAAKGQPPQQCTFVPDDESQPTSDHGWQFPQDAARLVPLIAEAKSLGIRVSLFMDPLPESMRFVREAGADRVELYTESYARAHGTPDAPAVVARFAAAALAAQREGLGINAGHDLNRTNLVDFLRAVPGVQEVSIGHALIADAVELGLAETVRQYLLCIHQAAE
jgi:pyridoxine 5-phosphate synthase